VRPQPRVLLLLDPRPGTALPDQLSVAGGGSLLDLVQERSVAEAGESAGVIHGKAGLAELLALPAAGQPSEQPDLPARSTCLIDAAELAFATTYGDLVADPRPGPAVLRGAESDRALAVRLDLEDIDDAGDIALLVRAIGSAPAGGALTVLAGALTAIGRPPRELGAGPLPVNLVAGQDDLDHALAEQDDLDEAALRLRRSSRADDGFLSTFLVRPLSRQVTRRAVPVGITPMAVTAVSFLLGLLAALAYAGGSLPWRLLGSLLLFVSLVVDCVDGEIARYTRTSSPRGGWLDIASDRTKEYAVYAGLAAGVGGRGVWSFAAATFVVLLVRHFVDFGYAVSAIGRVPGSAGGGGGGPTREGEGRVGAWSERTNRVSGVMWAKRAIGLPVGERTLLLVVLAPALGARWALFILLVLALVSATYSTAGRVGRRAFGRRTASPQYDSVASLRLRALVDPGPLAGVLTGLVPPVSRRLGWLSPALARVIEAGGLLLLVALHRPAALPAAYALFVVVALHQYDVVYRQRLGGAVQDDSVLGRVGFVARGVVVLLLVLVPLGDALVPVLWALTAVLAVLTCADSIRWWRAPRLAPLSRGRWLPTPGRTA
jgi:phosphatidylglycerophosphate synthase